MGKSLLIVVADDEPAARRYLEESLTRLGHRVISVSDIEQLDQECRSHEVGLVIANVKTSPSDDLHALERICQQRPVPVIVTSSHTLPETPDRAELHCAFGFLVKPINEVELAEEIRIARGRFEEIQVLRGEVGDLRQTLADRKLIERAKGLLMRQTGIDEADAFRRLQKLARDKSKKLVEIAETIITAHQAVEAVDQDK